MRCGTPLTLTTPQRLASEDLQVRWMMEADGYRPQGRVWGSLITACGKAGQLGSAEALWTEMLAAGAAPTEDQYQALMNACVWTFQVLAGLAAPAATHVRRRRGLQRVLEPVSKII